jgi:hypothetical protein
MIEKSCDVLQSSGSATVWYTLSQNSQDEEIMDHIYTAMLPTDPLANMKQRTWGFTVIPFDPPLHHESMGDKDYRSNEKHCR